MHFPYLVALAEFNSGSILFEIMLKHLEPVWNFAEAPWLRSTALGYVHSIQSNTQNLILSALQHRL